MCAFWEQRASRFGRFCAVFFESYTTSEAPIKPQRPLCYWVHRNIQIWGSEVACGTSEPQVYPDMTWQEFFFSNLSSHCVHPKVWALSFKCTFMWRSKLSFLSKVFPQGSHALIDFDFFGFTAVCLTCLFRFPAWGVSNSHNSHLLTFFCVLCFLMWFWNFCSHCTSHHTEHIQKVFLCAQHTGAIPIWHHPKNLFPIHCTEIEPFPFYWFCPTDQNTESFSGFTFSLSRGRWTVKSSILAWA